MNSLRKSWCQFVSQIVSPFAQTPDWSVRFAIVPKTAQFARCHCPFYRSAFQVPSLLNSSLDPCPRVQLSAPADVAKHNYSTGPVGAKSAARCSLKRASANPGLMEPVRCGRRAKKWIAGLVCFFRPATRAYRSGCPRSMTSNARHARQRHVTEAGFCTSAARAR